MATRPEIERAELPGIPGQPEILSLPPSGPVIVPGGGLMTDAVFARVDGDLLIELSGGARLIVRDYFFAQTPPPLVTDAGAHLGPDVVSALAGIDAAETPTLAAVAARGLWAAQIAWPPATSNKRHQCLNVNSASQ